MQRYIFIRGIVFLQLLCLFLAAGAGQAGELEREYLRYSKDLFKMVDRVNRTWNRRIKPMSDTEHYGVPSKWAFPSDGISTCKGYAIAKKRALCHLGIISFYALCRCRSGTSHLVLFVYTTRGALVLDNLTDRLRFASECPYTWLIVQFPGDVWKDYATGKPVYPPEGYKTFLEEDLNWKEG